MDEPPVIASYLVRIHVRAKAKSVKVPTVQQLEELIADAVENDSIENGGGDSTASVSVSAERIDI